MQLTLPASRQPVPVHILRSQAVNVTRGCFASRPQALCRTRVQRESCSRSLSTSRPAQSRHQKCQAAQSEASIDQDSDLVGEDAAFFDVKQQTTKSWTLFTGLLIGVLGLIYVVRTCAALQQHSKAVLADSMLTLLLVADMGQS